MGEILNAFKISPVGGRFSKYSCIPFDDVASYLLINMELSVCVRGKRSLLTFKRLYFFARFYVLGALMANILVSLFTCHFSEMRLRH